MNQLMFLKGQYTQKSFAHPHAIPNLNDCLYSLKHEENILKKYSGNQTTLDIPLISFCVPQKKVILSFNDMRLCKFRWTISLTNVSVLTAHISVAKCLTQMSHYWSLSSFSAMQWLNTNQTSSADILHHPDTWWSCVDLYNPTVLPKIRLDVDGFEWIPQ